jgi:hypothetical protein
LLPVQCRRLTESRTEAAPSVGIARFITMLKTILICVGVSATVFVVGTVAVNKSEKLRTGLGGKA